MLSNQIISYQKNCTWSKRIWKNLSMLCVTLICDRSHCVKIPPKREINVVWSFIKMEFHIWVWFRVFLKSFILQASSEFHFNKWLDDIDFPFWRDFNQFDFKTPWNHNHIWNFDYVFFILSPSNWGKIPKV